MSKKKLETVKNPLVAKHDKKERKEKKPSIKPETSRAIVIVLLFAFAAIFLLSMLSMAGSVGSGLELILTKCFGWGRPIFAVILLLLGWLLINPEKHPINKLNWVGLTVFVLSFYALLSVISHSLQHNAYYGGGYVGVILAYPLLKGLGVLATLIILFALWVISILLMFNLSLRHLLQQKEYWGRLIWKIKVLWYKLFHKEHKPEVVEQAPIPLSAEDIDTFSEHPVAGEEAEVSKAVQPEQLALIPKPVRRHRHVQLPLDLLDDKKERPLAGNIEENKETIKKTLANFGIEVEMGDIQIGPTVTQYTLRPAEGVKLSRIITLSNDLALALAAHPIRIEAPIPGKSLVGIEVPNQSKAVISLREMLNAQEFRQAKGNLKVTLGVDVSGHGCVPDLDPMPHCLIAGATGSGKSVCINSLIVSLLYQHGPDDLKLIMVDPKRVEFSLYNGIPHLLTPVITEVDKTINALKWTVSEMDRRYDLLSKQGKRNIQGYNAANPNEPLPYIVLVIDELADLMATSARDVEAAIVRLAQMARAVGIHLILATQRPSVDVITGLIKANITARVAFNVASVVDSRTILDSAGAEKLLGKGDMLYICAELSKPKRLQGPLLSEKEIERVVSYLKEKAEPEYNEEITERHSSNMVHNGSGYVDEEVADEFLDEAKSVIMAAGKASASLLQRRLRIGYARAARILDILEEQGFIGPADGARPREILGSPSHGEGQDNVAVNNEQGAEEDV